MKKILVLLASVALFFSCSSMKLERKLPRDIRNWYDLHNILMQTKVPKWIFDGNHSERWCFLRIPEEAQRMYIANFWKVRQEGLEELFYSRVEIANSLFKHEGREGWKTDRGRVLILCGQPNLIQWYHNGQVSFKPGMIGSGQYTQVWLYWQQRVVVRYAFEYKGVNSWHIVGSLRYSQGQQYFENTWHKIFAPTEWGWEMIGSWVFDWMKEKK